MGIAALLGMGELRLRCKGAGVLAHTPHKTAWAPHGGPGLSDRDFAPRSHCPAQNSPV